MKDYEQMTRLLCKIVIFRFENFRCCGVRRHSMRITMSQSFLALIIFGLLWSPAFAQKMFSGDSQPPIEVGVVALTKQDIPRTYTIPGRAVAHDQAEIRPRVEGIIESIDYDPNLPIKVGDPLFILDDASKVAAVASDEAEVAAAEADLPVAQAAYDRAAKLEGSGVSVADVEQARSTLASAKATLSAAQAALDYSNVELSWTTIASPLDGFASAPNFSVGDLVTSGQSDALTTITSLDPIDVDILETSARILKVRRQAEAGILKMNDRIPASLILETGEVYKTTGSLIAPAYTVSTTTGTVALRFQFNNPEGIILPGMFVRGTVELGTINALLVPQRAATRETNGSLSALIVGDDDTAQTINFEDEGSWNNSWIVTEGIEPDTRVIVDGLKFVKAGAKIISIDATVDEDGLVQDNSDASATEE
ncbi:efflux RND transporter periplasmic adaptor subunit [Paracoccus sp. R86501]|uniref:efflux RND transporter periplasmic adaptor subunit n=1 Tax=Paracoccus sp. R86501 TaxID=3101711 RepID=UPI00366C9F99